MNASNHYEVISADSHVVEPPDIFDARLPSALRDRAPRLVTHEGGSAWLVDGVHAERRMPLPPDTRVWNRVEEVARA